MADISNVRTSEIKEISDALEALSCKFGICRLIYSYIDNF
jgi:hypothetical protein